MSCALQEGLWTQFVKCVEQYLISDATRELIEPLLVEGISLWGIGRVMGVELKWLLGFVVTYSAALPLACPARYLQSGRHDATA